MCYLRVEWLAQYNGIELESRQNAFLSINRIKSIVYFPYNFFQKQFSDASGRIVYSWSVVVWLFLASKIGGFKFEFRQMHRLATVSMTLSSVWISSTLVASQSMQEWTSTYLTMQSKDSLAGQCSVRIHLPGKAGWACTYLVMQGDWWHTPTGWTSTYLMASIYLTMQGKRPLTWKCDHSPTC
jgi:hypothetical protein